MPDRERQSWELKLAPSEAALGVSLVLKDHLIHSPRPGTGGLAERTIFNEEYAPLCANAHWQTPEEVSLEGLVATTVQLTHAFQATHQTEILVQAIAILELCIRLQGPSVLCAGSIRPLLLAAFVLSAKVHHDEAFFLSEIVSALQHVGFDAISSPHLVMLELGLLKATAGQLHMTRQTYTHYAFELRALVSHVAAPLMVRMPELADVLRHLDSQLTDGALDEETRPSPRNFGTRMVRAQTLPP